MITKIYKRDLLERIEAIERRLEALEKPKPFVPSEPWTGGKLPETQNYNVRDHSRPIYADLVTLGPCPRPYAKPSSSKD